MTKRSSEDVEQVVKEIKLAPTCKHCVNSVGTARGGLVCRRYNLELVAYPTLSMAMNKRTDERMKAQAAACPMYSREPGAD